MDKNEIEKALYKEKPTAVQTGYWTADKENEDRYVYETQLSGMEDKLRFIIPVSEMGMTVFEKEMPAQLLRRWLI